MKPGPQEVYGAIDARYPFETAYEWDNSGWQLMGTRPVGRCVVALDPSPGAVQATLDHQAELLITHHPLFFPHARTIDPSSPPGDALRRLLAAEVGLLAAHTNVDRHPEGISGALADLLALHDQHVLSPDREEAFFKLVTFVPAAHLEQVRRGLAEAGAGQIGDYSECSFALTGIGTYRPGEGTRPLVGQVGNLEQVEEHRLEMRVPARRIDAVLGALRQSHPYEEVAFDLFPTHRQGPPGGIGILGEWSEAVPLPEALERIKRGLGGVPLMIYGDQTPIRRVAVAGGSTADQIEHAAAAGADLFIGGDLSYHRLLNGSERMVCVDPGHRATEQPGVERMAQRLREETARRAWAMEVITYHDPPAPGRVL